MTRKGKRLIPVHSRAEIPHFESDAERAEFWDTHAATAELVEETRRERAKLGLPPRGARAIALAHPRKAPAGESSSER
jgi:hypothetical protein